MKEIKLLYFGLIAELTGKEEETIRLEEGTIGDLERRLLEQYPDLASSSYRFAQNLELVTADTPLADGEVAVLPPFAGG